MKRPFAAALLLTIAAASAVDAQSEKKTLASQLEQKAAESAKNFPEAIRSKFAQGIADVAATGIVDKALNVGDKVPAAELFNKQGPVQLSSLWAEKPIVLTFYRGGWCPYCNLSLRAMQQSLDKLQGAGARVVAVTPELPENVAQTVKKNELTMLALSDKGNRLAKAMGVAFELPDAILPIYRDRLKLATVNGDESYTLPLAATYVIDTTGTIRWAFLDADYKKRAEPADVIKAVQKLGAAGSGSKAGSGEKPGSDKKQAAALPQPMVPHEQLAREVGVWDAQMTVWPAPDAEPFTVTAVETNAMLGPYWLMSEFKCDTPESPFAGRMQLGYDPQKEKFVATWVDTKSPYAAMSEGTYNIATHSLTLVSHGVDAQTGEPNVSTMITRYVDQDTKEFAIHEGDLTADDGGSKGWKMMEITYKRRK